MIQERHAPGFLQLFLQAPLAYLWGVGMTPAQSVEDTAVSGVSNAPCMVHAAVLDDLWQECDASTWGLSRTDFDSILSTIGVAQNFGLPSETVATRQQQAAWFRSLKLNDLVLARACAAGNERAWQRFVALYEQSLIRAAIAITGSDTVGRDLAGQLYAELYGLNTRDGQRRCPLESYRGRGSLIGWLRTTLAQRHVDHFRRTRREEPIEDFDAPAADPVPVQPPADLQILGKSIEGALRGQEADARFLLASYYIDGRTLAEIALVLRVHEATVSRKLHRAIDGIRKQVFRNLEASGLSRRAAQEALGADPRDLDIHFKKLLQDPPPQTFQEKVAL
jgi:RNA polymerase sigma-70 factor (ECF subfamily)